MIDIMVVLVDKRSGLTWQAEFHRVFVLFLQPFANDDAEF